MNDKLHEQAVSIELNKTIKQEKLNKQRLLANPEKRFLELNVQLDIDRRKELIDQLKLRTIRQKSSTELAKAKFEQENIKLNQSRLAEELIQIKSKVEIDKFNLTSAKLQSAQAVNRFPSAYSFILAIEDSLKVDGIRLSLYSLSEIVAYTFGYKSFYHLLSDEDFNNKKFSDISYIYYDRSELAINFEKISNNEKNENIDISSDIIFEKVISIFENLPFKMIAKDEAIDISRDIAEKYKNELLNGEELSGIMADSDTTYEEVNINDVDSFEFSHGIKIVFSGIASGSHRREPSVHGRDIKFSMEIRSSLLIGTRAMGNFEVGEITGDFEDDFY